MAKKCPKCGYSSVGFFVDHCPMCAERVAGGIGWSAGFQTLPVWGRWLVGGTAAAVLGVGVYWGLGGRPSAVAGTAGPHLAGDSRLDRGPTNW